MGLDAGTADQPLQDVLLAQYGVVAARRQNFDSMVWQVPALALTAQAFLMTIALGPGTGHLARIAAGLLSALAALMSVQLLLRQRVHEIADARWLHDFELKHGWEPVHQHPADRVTVAGIKSHRLARMRSHQLWIAGMALFGAAGLAAAFAALLRPSRLIPTEGCGSARATCGRAAALSYPRRLHSSEWQDRAPNPKYEVGGYVHACIGALPPVARARSLAGQPALARATHVSHARVPGGQ